MSLVKLSALTGIDKSHLSRAERGLAGLGDANIHRLADALSVSTSDITNQEET